MTAITSYQDAFFQQIESSTVPNPRLANALDPNDLTIVLSAGILTSDSVAPTKAFVLTINNPDGPELVYVKSGQVSADGKTITLTNTNQRNINRAESSTGAIDFESGDGGVTSHPAFTDVRVSIDPLTWAAQNKVIRGELASGGVNWKVGRGIDENINWVVANGDTNEPFFRYDSTASTSGAFVISNDGVSSSLLAAGVNPTGGDGITVTSGVVAVDLASTNDLQKFTLGQLDTNLTATKTEIDQLAGTTNIAEANTFFGATNITGAEAETLTAGAASDADALHTHPALLNSKTDFSTEFGVLARLTTSVGGTMSMSISTNGLKIDPTTGSGARFGKATMNIAGQIFNGSPEFFGNFIPLGSAGGFNESYLGLGDMTTTTSGHTFTDNHIGFKVISNGTTQLLYGTVGDGVTEAATASLLSIAGSVVPIEIYFRVNATSVDFYARQNGGTWVTASLSTNLPSFSTAVNVCQASCKASDAYPAGFFQFAGYKR